MKTAIVSEKLKDLISHFFAYALLVAGASLVSIAVWTHAHAAGPIIQNALGVAQNNNDIASGFHISRDIREFSTTRSDILRKVRRK